MMLNCHLTRNSTQIKAIIKHALSFLDFVRFKMHTPVLSISFPNYQRPTRSRSSTACSFPFLYLFLNTITSSGYSSRTCLVFFHVRMLVLAIIDTTLKTTVIVRLMQTTTSFMLLSPRLSVIK